MATQPDDEPLELTEELEVEEPAEEQDEQTPAEEPNPDEEGEEETVVSFGDDETVEREDDSAVIRSMRAKLREKDTRIRELEQAGPSQKPVELGPKPELYGEECAGDEELYDKKLLEWHERKRQIAAQEERQEEQAKAANESWLAAKQRYQSQAEKHGFDIQDDQDAVEQALGINAPVILKAANDAALMVKALGSNPAKLAELAKIKDPFELAAAVARMEGGVKVVKKRKGPVIDKPQSGSGSLIPTDSDKELEKLEKEAERTNDRTKINAYKRQLKRKATAK